MCIQSRQKITYSIRQFFITLVPTPQCDGKHVIFGEVVSGFEILDYAQTVGTTDGEPKVPVSITDCGIYDPLQTPASGYWYDQPDAESYGGISPVFMVQPRVAILAPSSSVLENFRKKMGRFVVFTGIAVDNLGGTEEIRANIEELLGNFRVDVVLVAPACKSITASMNLPPMWCTIDNSLTVDQVLLECKPADALRVIQTQSWLSTKSAWHFDSLLK